MPLPACRKAIKNSTVTVGKNKQRSSAGHGEVTHIHLITLLVTTILLIIAFTLGFVCSVARARGLCSTASDAGALGLHAGALGLHARKARGLGLVPAAAFAQIKSPHRPTHDHDPPYLRLHPRIRLLSGARALCSTASDAGAWRLHVRKARGLVSREGTSHPRGFRPRSSSWFCPAEASTSPTGSELTDFGSTSSSAPRTRCVPRRAKDGTPAFK